MLEINRTPGPRDLRLFGCVGLPVFVGFLGFLARRATGHDAPAWVAGAAAAFSVLLGVLRPSALRAPFVGLQVVMFPLAWLVSHLLLGAIYLLVVTPVGWLVRLLRGDPMTRAFDPSLATYWTTRGPDADVERYFRQS